jgi:hypothetical protein
MSHEMLYWLGEYHVRGFILVVDNDDIFYRSRICQQQRQRVGSHPDFPTNEYIFGHDEPGAGDGIALRSWKSFKQFIIRKSSKKVKPTDLTAIVG